MNKIIFAFLSTLIIFSCSPKQEKKMYDENQTASETTATGDVEVTGINIGDQAIEINLPNPNGEYVKLSSFRGKYVLVDFWASWCGPCRMENPNVVNLYKKYKDKGFEIYGVSLDMDKKSWLEAIQKDNLTWTQVSDLAYWNSIVVANYRISGIPATVLLDKEGKIIAKDLRGPELEAKLKEELN